MDYTLLITLLTLTWFAAGLALELALTARREN